MALALIPASAGLRAVAADPDLRRAARRVIGVAVGGYLAGTTPSAVVAARVAGGRDPRTSGTGNPGAANVAATSGKTVGLVVLVADIAKAYLAARAGGRVLGASGRHLGGVAAVVGHCHPVWSGFRGGKGVATSVGQVLATFPVYAPLDAAVAVGTAAVPSLAADAERTTTAASSVWVGAALWWWRRGWPNPGAPAVGPGLPLAAAVSSAVILGRFRAERLAVQRARDAGETLGDSGRSEDRPEPPPEP